MLLVVSPWNVVTAFAKPVNVPISHHVHFALASARNAQDVSIPLTAPQIAVAQACVCDPDMPRGRNANCSKERNSSANPVRTIGNVSRTYVPAAFVRFLGPHGYGKYVHRHVETPSARSVHLHVNARPGYAGVGVVCRNGIVNACDVLYGRRYRRV